MAASGSGNVNGRTDIATAGRCQSRIPAVGLPLEPVVEVEVVAAAPGEEAGQEVCREEERPPPLVLADVDVLVVPGVVQAVAVLTEDDVPEGEGRGVDQQAPAEEEPGEPAVQ